MMLPDNCVGIIEYCFIKYDENTKLDPGDYIVILEFKYNWEKNFHYEINVLSVLGDRPELDSYLNDTYEGQEHFKILAYCPLDFDINYIKAIVREVNNEKVI